MEFQLNNNNKNNNNKMLYISFNQDASCFSVGTETGFTIFNLNPFKEIFNRGKIKFLFFFIFLYIKFIFIYIIILLL